MPSILQPEWQDSKLSPRWIQTQVSLSNVAATDVCESPRFNIISACHPKIGSLNTPARIFWDRANRIGISVCQEDMAYVTRRFSHGRQHEKPLERKRRTPNASFQSHERAMCFIFSQLSTNSFYYKSSDALANSGHADCFATHSKVVQEPANGIFHHIPSSQYHIVVDTKWTQRQQE